MSDLKTIFSYRKHSFLKSFRFHQPVVVFNHIERSDQYKVSKSGKGPQR